MELTRDRLAERIARSQPQLVLLVAPSGFGKTVLTQQIAEQCDVRVLDLGSGPPAGAAGSIVRLLSAAPQTATVVVACRRPLSFPASKVAPPHRILTLRATDLAFDEDEIARLFAPFDLSNDDLATVAHTTCGWPIGALLLRRFAEEGRLAHLLTRPDDPAFDEPYAYLVDEVLAPLSPAEQRAVLCCAAIEGPTAQDVAAALGSDLAFDGILDAAPFIERRSDGVYALHSLLQHAVRRRFDGSCAALAVAAARAHENAQRYLRAAQIYRNAGLLDDMARAGCSDNARPNRRQSADFSNLVASLDRETLARHRVLRGLSTYPKRFRVDPHRLRDEAEAVWRTLPRDVDFETRCNVAGPLTRIMYETGRFEEAERILRALEHEAGGIPEVPKSSGEAYVARTLACVLARSGRLSEADAYFRKGYLMLPRAEMVESRYAIERAIIERLHGRRSEERRFAERAIELAFEQNASVHIACALAEAAFGAWLAGEDALFSSYLDRLEERVSADGMRGFAHFCAAARGQEIPQPNGTEQPNWLACAHLIACARTKGTQRRSHAKRAKETADESNDIFLQVLAGVALAIVASDRRNELLLEALVLTGTIDAQSPQAAVTALLSQTQDLGILGPLVARLRDQDRSEPVLIEILRRRVRRNGATIELRERELELVMALALARRGCSRAEIASRIWPDLEESGARDALNTCLYRLRRRLGEDAVTYSRTDGYRLADGVRVDLREIEQWLAATRGRKGLQRHERTMLRGAYERLRDARLEASEEQSEWMEPIVARVREMRQAAGERLAREALLCGEQAEALRIARELSDDDPCDETACDLAIRAHRDRGDHAAAARRFARSATSCGVNSMPNPRLSSPASRMAGHLPMSKAER